MKSDPRVLVAVPTYGRPQFLPRILANFDRLQYENKKLVIINDDLRTKYSFSPDAFSNTWNNINIINLENETPMPISKKRNLFLDWDWDIIFFLDDDDIFLPERLINHIKIYNKYPDIDVVKPSSYFITYDMSLELKAGGCVMNFSITRNGVDKAGKLNEDILGSGEDSDWWHKINNSCNIHYIDEDANLADFVYYFTGSNYHTSTTCREGTQEELDKLNQFIGDYLVDNNYQKHITLFPDYKSYDSVIEVCSKLKESAATYVNYDWLNDQCTGIIQKSHEHRSIDINEVISLSKARLEDSCKGHDSQICPGIRAQQHPGAYYALHEFFSRNKFDCLIEIGTGQGGLTKFLHTILPGIKIHSFDVRQPGGFNLEQLSSYPNLSFYNLDCFAEDTIKKIQELTANKKTCWMFDGADKNKEFNTYNPIARPEDLLLLHDFARNLEKYEEIYNEKKRWRWHEAGFEDILDLEEAEWAGEELLEQCLWGTYKKL